MNNKNSISQDIHYLNNALTTIHICASLMQQENKHSISFQENTVIKYLDILRSNIENMEKCIRKLSANMLEEKLIDN